MISHNHRCVFVHIPKCAGQSIDHVFLNNLGLNWETRAPLLLRYNERPEIGPPRLAHLKVEEYVRYKYLSQELLDQYFKFSFVRNPWDRLISIYKYLDYDRKYEFKYFLMKIFANDIWKTKYWFVGPQYEYVCNSNGDVIVDYIGKFESLQNDFNIICGKVNLPPTMLPHINKSGNKAVATKHPIKYLKDWVKNHKRNKFPQYSRYQDYYDNESREFAADLYKRDISIFGYTFDNDSNIK